MAGIFLKQSTASQSRAIGPFLDDTDFKTAETGLTIANTDIKLVVNGGASANKNSGGGTHRVNGHYGVTFDATDTATVGEMAVSVVVSGALPVFKTFFVLEEAVYDAFFAASATGVPALGALEATSQAILTDTGTTLDGRIPAALSSGGYMKCDVEEVVASATAAARLARSARAATLATVGTGSTTTSIVFSSFDPSSAADDQFNGRVLLFVNDTTTSTLRGQGTAITDYVHGTLTATVTALTTAPVSGDVAIIL